MNSEIIGYVAGFFTTIAFIPQVMRSLKRRSCHDLSWLWLGVFVIGLSLWLTYGIALNNWPMILANSITLLLCFTLGWIKIRYKEAAD